MPVDTKSQPEYVRRTACLREDCDPAKDWRIVVQAYDYESHTGTYDMVRCRNCDIGFTNPYPTEETVHLLYEMRTSSDYDLIRNSYVDKIKDFLARRLLKRRVPRQWHSQAIRFLDYGTGNGRFPVFASEVFPEAHVDAVDFLPNPPEFLKRFATPRTTYLSTDDFARQSRRYDVIFLRQVLEHTHHPLELLTLLASRLTPAGVLYVDVPNLDSGCGRVFGGSWRAFYVPRHIFHFSARSLSWMCEAAGLRAEIGRAEVPLMGNQLAIILGLRNYNIVLQTLGILLHPVQLAIEKFYHSSSCFTATCHRADFVSGTTSVQHPLAPVGPANSEAILSHGH